LDEIVIVTESHPFYRNDNDENILVVRFGILLTKRFKYEWFIFAAASHAGMFGICGNHFVLNVKPGENVMVL